MRIIFADAFYWIALLSGWQSAKSRIGYKTRDNYPPYKLNTTN